MKAKRKNIFNISNEFVRILYLFRKMPNLDPNYPTLPYVLLKNLSSCTFIQHPLPEFWV